MQASISPTNQPPLMTVAEVAEWLRTTPAAVYKMAERRQLPGVRRIGRRLLFTRQTVVHRLGQNRTLSSKGDR